jgi:hypothetical protein
MDFLPKNVCADASPAFSYQKIAAHEAIFFDTRKKYPLLREPRQAGARLSRFINHVRRKYPVMAARPAAARPWGRA